MLKIAICDDDRRDRQPLFELIREHANCYKKNYDIQMFESGERYLESGYIADILFLDIVMNRKDGIQIGEEIKEKRKDAIIIYTSNLSEKIMTAFNMVHSFGFLVKPVIKEELFSVLSDAVEQIEYRKNRGKEVVTFPSEDNTVIELSVDNIMYFEYRNRKVVIKTKEKEYFCKMKMKEIEEKMQKYNFVMSHRSFVVNLYGVERFAEQALVMKNGDMVCLSQKRASTVRKQLMQLASEAGKAGRE